MITVGNINAMLGLPFGLSGAFTPAGKFYLGLSTTPLRDNGSGYTEPDASCGYERFEIVNNETSWKIDKGVVSNLNQFEFPELLANAGIATHWFISASKTGDAEFFGRFTYERPLAIHSVIFVNPGDLKIILENVRDEEDFDIHVIASEGGNAIADTPRALYGEEVNLLATASEGYRFVEWKPNTYLSDLITDNAVSGFTMPSEDVVITAVFKQEYDVDVTATDGGQAEADKEVAIGGEEVALTALAEDTHGFVEWETDNDLPDLDTKDADSTFTMPGEKVSVKAKFDKKYSITVTPTTGGTASADIVSAIPGTLITLTATPNEEYRFSGWTSTPSNLEGLENSNATTSFIMPAQSVTLTAAFVQ